MIVDRIEALGNELGIDCDADDPNLLQVIGWGRSRADYMLSKIEGKLGLKGAGYSIGQRLARCQFLHLDREESRS